MEPRGSPDHEGEQIVQVREALMCPDGEKFEGLRTARFLNYTTTSIDDDVFELPLDAFAYRPPDKEKWTANVSFSGWRSPSLNWIEWVNAMAESYATVWKESGVYDAIMASRYQIKKQDDLIMALVDKWCIETNTFVFPWGEVTMTLEDMIVLGGFSVTGNNALALIKRENMKEVEEKLKKTKREIEANLEKKCCVSLWMKEMMMKSGNEIEHEAFMVTWLSRFVFPNSADLLKEKLFPAAIQLAKGVKVALAPAVLARIYCDLGVLKKHLAGYSTNETVVVKSPFQFVQVWALERIMELQPPGQPSQLKPGEPRIARWHHHGGGEDVYGNPENIRAALDSAKESFDYRPYTKPLTNFKFPMFYLEDDSWVRVRPDESIVAFARCLRFAKLVGLDCIEPYYPHRVALQFGYDQDVPGVVPARTETPELAWKDYIRPISDGVLYIPARLHEADVTVGYIRWWKQSVAVLQSEAKKISHKLLASPPKHKPVPTTTSPITTKAKPSSPGKWKPSGAKAEGKDQEGAKKREMETNRGTSVTDSQQGTKRPVKVPEWVQRSSPKSPGRSSGRVVDDVKGLKGALRGSKVTKGQGHVTFQLPSSPARSPSKTYTPSPKQSDSPVKKPMVSTSRRLSSSPQVPRPTSNVNLPPKPEKYIKNQSSTRPRDSRELSPSFSGSPLKRKKSPRSPEPLNPHGQKDSSSPRVSKESYKPSSFSGSSSSTRKMSPRSPEPFNPHGQKDSSSPSVSKESYKPSSFSGSSSSTRKNSPRSPEAINSRDKNNSPTPQVSKERYKPPSSSCPRKKPPPSPRATKELNKPPSVSGSPPLTIKKSPRSSETVKCLEEIVTLREQVGEGDEVTYQIPKQQFEDLSQGVHDVLHDLQSIKLALNIQDNDE